MWGVSLFCIALNTKLLSLCYCHNSITCIFHINYLHEWIQWGPWHFCTSIGICIDYSNLLWLVTRFGFFSSNVNVMSQNKNKLGNTLFKKRRYYAQIVHTRTQRNMIKCLIYRRVIRYRPGWTILFIQACLFTFFICLKVVCVSVSVKNV